MADSPRGVLVAFGEALRRLRRDRGMTQEQLAEASGLHPRYVSDVERGVRNVGLVNVARLAGALGLGLESLMAEVERQAGVR